MSENAQAPEATDATPEAPSAWDAAFDALAEQVLAPDSDELDLEAAPAPEEQEPAAAAEEAEPEQRDEGVEKALANLKALGVPERLLGDLSDAEALDWWASREKSEKDTKAAFSERAELRRKLEELEATNTPAEPQGEPTAVMDLPELRMALTEKLDEEVAETLVEGIAPIHSRVEKIAAGIPHVAGLVEELAMRSLRADLKESFPGVDDAWDSVETRVRDLSKSGVHGDKKGLARLSAIMEDAARYEGLTARVSAPAPPTPSNQPNVATSPSVTPPTPPRMTQEQIQDAKIAYIMDHPEATPEEIIQRFGG